MDDRVRLAGRVTSGRGEAAGFTRLDWVCEQFRRALGIDPYPGTLNLALERGADHDAWAVLRSRRGIRIDPPTGPLCAARCYAVRVNDRLPGGVVVPEVPGYPASQVEIVAAVSIRNTLVLADGDEVTLQTTDPLPVRAIIFDVDGTLVDSLAAYRIVANRAAGPYGLTITDAMVRDALNTTRHFWDLAVPADMPDRAAAIEALRSDAGRLWPDVLREHGRMFPDAAGALRALRDRGTRFGIMTGSRRGSLDPIRRAGCLHLFDAVVTGEDVRRRKPDPEGLLACAARLQVAPREAAYLGDTPLDMQAARAAGMFAVGLLTGAGDSAMLSAAGADRLIGSLGWLGDPSSVVI